MALKDKIGLVDLSDIANQPAKDRLTAMPRTAIGIHAQQLHQDEQIRKENAALKSKLSEFEGSNPVRKLNSLLVKPSKWANRIEETFAGKEFADLKQEIAESGGNIQPIKVRPIEQGQFEIVYGHRRHRACLELGLDVLALISDVDDQTLFIQMEQENRQRSDPRPYERGLMYAKALDHGLYSSIRQLAIALQMDPTGLSRCLMLARLPSEVLMAFSSPLDITYDWASPLTEAVDSNRDAVIAEANKIRSEREGGSQILPKLIMSRLVDSVNLEKVKKTPPPLEIKGQNGQKAKLKFDINGGAKLTFSKLSQKNLDQLEDLIKRFLNE